MVCSRFCSRSSRSPVAAATIILLLTFNVVAFVFFFRNRGGDHDTTSSVHVVNVCETKDRPYLLSLGENPKPLEEDSLLSSSFSSSYLSDDGLLITRKNPVPQKPLVCLSVISCNRIPLLNRTIWSMLSHMENYEPDIPYEIVWIDFASPTKERSYISSSYQINIRLFSEKPRGFGWPVSLTFFGGLCSSSQYVITLEEDWEVIENVELLIRQPLFVKEAIDILKDDPKILGVLLRPEVDSYVSCKLPPTILNTTSYIRRDVKHRHLSGGGCTYGCCWGAFTNGAAVYDLSRIRTLKKYQVQSDQYSRDPECLFANEAAKEGFSLAHVVRNTSCSDPCSSLCHSVVRHIGDVRSKEICNGVEFVR